MVYEASAERRYELDMDVAESLIRDLYRNEAFCAADNAVAACFQRLRSSGSAGDIASCVVVLDGVFGTQLFRDAGAAERIIRSLKDQWAQVSDAIRSLDAVELGTSPETVYEAATRVFPTVLGAPLIRPGKSMQHYSFCSKFFHWLTERHFPMVDSNARSSINAFQRRQGIVKGRVMASTAEMWGETYLEEYHRWITFYSELVRGLSPQEQERLTRADFDNQYPALRVRHSLLRTLDLVFYARRGKTSLIAAKHSAV